MALNQSISPHTGVRTIQNTGVFWQAVFQPPRPYSILLEHGSAAKSLISHPHNTASCAGYKPTETSVFEFYLCMNSSLEELIKIKVIFILTQGMFS